MDKPFEQIAEHDSNNNESAGEWISSTNVDGYLGNDYVYANANTDANFSFKITSNSTGLFGVSTHYSSNQDRASNVRYELIYDGETRIYNLDQRILGSRWRQLDTISLQAGNEIELNLNALNTDGYVCADAFRIYPIESCITSTTTEVELAPKNYFECYPNPSSGKLFFQWNDIVNPTGYTIEIYDGTGQKLNYLVNQLSDPVEIYFKEKGIYFVHLVDAAFQTLQLKKVIIQ